VNVIVHEMKQVVIMLFCFEYLLPGCTRNLSVDITCPAASLQGDVAEE